MPCQPDEEESNVGLLPPHLDPAKMVGNYRAYDGDSEYEKLRWCSRKMEWGVVVRNQGQGLLDSKIKFLSYLFGLRVFLSFNNLSVCMISDIDVIFVQD